MGTAPPTSSASLGKPERGSLPVDGPRELRAQFDPILGGVCVIQAKRYSKVVPANDVRALWGAMEDKHATLGVLVTPSWFGSASREFDARHQERMRLIEGPELKHPAGFERTVHRRLR